jgi:TDG/mug DNA glycosylase family protein
MLPDLLKRNLSLVICGTGAGQRSAEIGHYYAEPGNRFWQMLAELRLTPQLLAPADYERLLSFDIGLTDLVKDQAGSDTQVRFGRGDALNLRAKMMLYQPRYLCFNGAAQEFFGSTRVYFGVQSERIGRTVLFAAPSTSRAANGSWDLTVWRDLATRVLRPRGAGRSRS